MKKYCQFCKKEVETEVECELWEVCSECKHDIESDEKYVTPGN